MKKHWKLLLFISIEFLFVITIVLLTVYAGNKTYTVTFDVNGGTYISGNLVQTVRHGQSATPPVVTKDGAFLLEWSEDYKTITKDKVIKAVWEYETSYGIEFEFIPNSNYCLVSGCYENTSGDVYIGANYNNMRVLGIKPGAFQNCTRITGIYLLDGLLSIGDNAFQGCSSLKIIDIPSTVEVIGTNILKDCNQLEKISVPFIGSDYGVDKNLYFSYLFGGSSVTANQTAVPSSLKSVNINGYGEIPARAFTNCGNIQEVTLSNNITKINARAFKNCESLESITIPDSITEIGQAAFLNCYSLKTISLGNALTTLGEGSFANCTSLSSVSIGSSLNNIPENAFQYCLNITNYNVSEENPNYTVQNNLLLHVKDGVVTVYSIIGSQYIDNLFEPGDIGGILIPDRFPTKDELENLFPEIDKELKDDEEKDDEEIKDFE